MSNGRDGREVVPARRSLLAVASGLAGVVSIKHWVRPVVDSVALPAHAQTTAAPDGPPRIFNLRVSEGQCVLDPLGFFNLAIEYDFTSALGVDSHMVTADCGDDTLEILAGNRNLGDNLLDDPISNQGSFILTGDQFSGSVRITSNHILGGSNPLSCDITVTLMDADGGQASDTVPVSRTCEPEE